MAQTDYDKRKFTKDEYGNLIPKQGKMRRTLIKTKEAARQKAIDWQHWQSKQNLSYAELAAWNSYFRELGARFNLTKEFKENEII